MAQRFDAARSLNSQANSALVVQRKLVSSSEAKVSRLDEQRVATSVDLDLISSSLVTGNMYLRMYDELHVGKGLPDQDFMDFFKMGVSISSEYFDPLLRDMRTKGKQYVKLSTQARGDAKVRADILKKGLRRVYGTINPPDWFEGKLGDWIDFVGYHAYSDKYLDLLDPEVRKKVAPHIAPPKMDIPVELESGRLYISSNGLPDWLSDTTSVVVPKDTVQQELDDDVIGIHQGSDKAIGLRSQVSYLDTLVNQKIARLAVRSTAGLVKLFDTPVDTRDDWTDLLTYLSAIDGLSIFLSNYDPNKQFDWREVLTKFIPDQVHEDAVIRKVTGDRLHREGLALYLERKLKEGKMIADVAEPVAEHKEALDALLKSPVDDRGLDALKGVNVRLFRTLNYDIKPLIQALPDDRANYLREYVQVLDQEPVEDVLWEIADAVEGSVDLKDVDLAKKDPLSKILEEVVRTNRSWLKANWRWVAEELNQSLHPNENNIEPVGTAASIIDEVIQPIVQETEEMETEAREIEAGALHDWKVMYTDNGSLDPRHFHDLSAETIQDREAAFKAFLKKEGIACPVKPESITNALDWVVTVPPETEQIRKAMYIGGVRFRKMDRDNIRIFYRQNPEDKELVFCIYIKKSWKYRKI